MSPNTNSNVSWDPSRLRLNQDGSRRSQGILAMDGGSCLFGVNSSPGLLDVSWLCQASHLGVKALLVGLALWHIRGLRKADTFIVSNLMVQDWASCPTQSAERCGSLKTLGLIRVEQRGKRSPQVTLVVEKGINGGAFMATVFVTNVQHTGRPRTSDSPDHPLR